MVAFTDLDNSLGFGGSAVQQLGTDDWLLRLDDAASVCCDDDDNELIINELIIRVRVVADDALPVPEPPALPRMDQPDTIAEKLRTASADCLSGL